MSPVVVVDQTNAVDLRQCAAKYYQLLSRSLRVLWKNDICSFRAMVIALTVSYKLVSF